MSEVSISKDLYELVFWVLGISLTVTGIIIAAVVRYAVQRFEKSMESGKEEVSEVRRDIKEMKDSVVDLNNSLTRVMASNENAALERRELKKEQLRLRDNMHHLRNDTHKRINKIELQVMSLKPIKE